METGLSLGSNLGDRLANLRQARAELCKIPGLNLTEQASVYETTPFDVPEQYNELLFLNTILVFETEQPGLNAYSLLSNVKEIEKTMGRTESEIRNTPRIIDIDILYMGDTRLSSETLSVPHKTWNSRRFILEPLAEIRPEMIMPGSDKTVAETLACLDDPEKAVKLGDRNW